MEPGGHEPQTAEETAAPLVQELFPLLASAAGALADTETINAEGHAVAQFVIADRLIRAVRPRF